MRDPLKVLAQQVPSEVPIEVAPHGMNVIGIVLRVVVLDQERRALHAVGMLFATREVASPDSSRTSISGVAPTRLSTR